MDSSKSQSQTQSRGASPQLSAKELKKLVKQERYAEKTEARRHSSLHIAAFILGIMSILGQWFWYVGVPAGILAIVFGARSARRTASRLGKAGLVLGIVGLSTTIFLYVSIILIAFLSSL